MARNINLNKGWHFCPGGLDVAKRMRGMYGDRVVNLPHDYMLENDVTKNAPAGTASGFYTAGVASYIKETEIPAEWEGEHIFLRFDGSMMNTTVEINGAKAALQHYGYAPFEADLTQLVYFGKMNRLVITCNPSMQPNSRWYSGAGIFRGVELVHVPAVHLAWGGLTAYTKAIDYRADGTPETAFLKLSAEVKNEFAENRVVRVSFTLIREDNGEAVKTVKAIVQVPPMGTAKAFTTMTVDEPRLWSADSPELYRLRVEAQSEGTYRTKICPVKETSCDADEVLFGIRTIEADVKHGLRINGKSVKLRGGCLHHDNGVIGAVSVYDAEARKISRMKASGFNAIRTTHNPPSSALIEACDRLGMYVFDEAFDAWGMGKQPGDYNQYFADDWKKDLTAFVRRDRCHPSVTIWSTGNEITERAGLGDGYELADALAALVRKLDPSRPISNGICSFWNGLDDELQEDALRKWKDSLTGGLQNADLGGKKDLLWEQLTEPFANSLDIVGYNYLEGKYEQDHEMFPERVIMGSENYPKEIGMHWPMIESTPWVIGDFTWTAWDYIGEAGIGKASFFDPEDPALQNGAMFLQMNSGYPWRLANDADFDITGAILPQGVYRRIVWGSGETAVFSYDPDVFGKTEVLSSWGFPGVQKNWSWNGREGKNVDVLVMSLAEEVELMVNGKSAGRLKAGEANVHEMPGTFIFHTVYEPGTVEAVGYCGGECVSRDVLRTVGEAASVRLVPENETLSADGASLAYIRAEIVDAEGRVVPDAAVKLSVKVSGAAELMGFGSANPITEQNYSSGTFTSYRGSAMAVLRAGYEPGEAVLAVSAEGLGEAEVKVVIV